MKTPSQKQLKAARSKRLKIQFRITLKEMEFLLAQSKLQTQGNISAYVRLKVFGSK